MFIALEGNIGAGKTTLAIRLAADLHAETLLEDFNGNPYLESFYCEGAHFALFTELSFLVMRNRALRAHFSVKNVSTVSDYWFGKSSVFGKTTLSEAENILFQDVFADYASLLPQPDVLVFLEAPVSLLRQRIEGRGRSMETYIKDQYLQRLATGYEAALLGCGLPVLRINIERYDLLQNADVYRALLNTLRGDLSRGIHEFVPA